MSEVATESRTVVIAPEDLQLRVVGHPVNRVDALEKVTGSAIYMADMRVPGMLYARVLRSKLPHARIVSIDVSAAERLAGVVAVAVGTEFLYLGGEAVRDMPFLAREKVRYVGEPVAAVAAVQDRIALKALELIEVKYEELPAVFDPLEAAQPGAPLVHENLEAYSHIGIVKPLAGTNVINYTELKHGDVQEGFAGSDAIFSDTFKIPSVAHGQIEPHCSIAQWGADGKITVWSCNDGPHRLRKDLADAMDIPLTQIRVIVPFIGGGFGGKGGLKAETIAVALARKTNHRPVRVLLSREEVFTSTVVRHAAVITVKTGVKKDGTLVAREVVGYWDTGAYAEKGPTVSKQGTTVSAGPYRIPHTRLVGYCVYTNKVVAGAFRGYGVPQAAWAGESQLDMIAKRLGIDPLEIRLKNILREGDTAVTGQIAQSIGLEECLRKVAAELRWGEASGPNRGKGLACTWKPTKTPSGSAAYATLNQDGTVNVLTSTAEVGQGSMTILSQIAAEELGVPLSKVRVSHPDTDVTPFDASTTGSRATFHMGNAVRIACQDIKTQLASAAAHLLDCRVEDLRVESGRVISVSDAAQSLSYEQVMRRAFSAGASMQGRALYYTSAPKGAGLFASPSVYWMYGAQGAEVEVDRETGQVEIIKVVAAHDVGRAINPTTVCGQIEGGVVCGIGTSLFEEIVLDRGRVVNANLHDYKMPTAMDVPEIVPIIVEAAHQEGPFGAKGVGEPVTCPTAPAIVSAVEDAVGVRIQELPLTAERVLEYLDRSAG